MRALILILVCALCVACGITKGTVVSRAYEDEYEEMVPMCAAYNSSGACTVTVFYPSTVPECWRINFADGDRENSICVGRSTWDAYKPGDIIDTETMDARDD